ncbi:MAG: hypothetical protein ACRYFA_06330 [Janthinobacterium lividum]
MEVFVTVLAGTDGLIEGTVSAATVPDNKEEYTFSSFDGSLNLVIAKDEHGHWKRISSTEPYLSGWIDDLGEQIDQQNSPAF